MRGSASQVLLSFLEGDHSAAVPAPVSVPVPFVSTAEAAPSVLAVAAGDLEIKLVALLVLESDDCRVLRVLTGEGLLPVGGGAAPVHRVVAAVGRVEARFAVPRRGEAALHPTRVPAAQIPIEMLPKYSADAVQCDRVHARIQKTGRKYFILHFTRRKNLSFSFV